MADNVQINTNTSSGATIATDECTINGTAVQVPRSKIGHGTDGSYSEVSTSSPLPVQLRNSSGTELGTSGAPVRTDPTGSTAQPVTDNGGSLTVDVPDGSDAALGAKADAAASTDTGTFSLIALFKRLLEKITAGLTVVGNVASGSADSGNPVKVGGVYNLSAPIVTNGRRVDLQVDANGRLIITQRSPNGGAYVLSDGSGWAEGTAGSIPLAVRKDAEGAFTGVDDGETTPLATDSAGRLRTAVGAVPADPFGTNADAAATAGSTGSISAKLRTISGDLDAAKVALQTLDNIVAGNEAQVDVVTQPARARTTDTMSAALATDALMNGTTALTPAFANINTATSGDQTLVAAVTSKKIRVVSLALIARGDVDAYFRSGTGGTALFGGGTAALDLTTNGGFVLPFNPAGWFETGSGAALVLNLSGAVGVAGGLTYVEV